MVKVPSAGGKRRISGGRTHLTRFMKTQEEYIRILEEQLAVQEQKDELQQMLIEQLSRMVELHEQEIKRLKRELADAGKRDRG